MKQQNKDNIKNTTIKIRTGSNKRKMIGMKGESIAANFLKRKGYEIIEKNYLKKCGEIDLITREGSLGKIHFVEVKTVIRETQIGQVGDQACVKRLDSHRAEDNVHRRKWLRLKRTIKYYLAEKFGDLEVDWQFDVVLIHLNPEMSAGTAVFMNNCII